MQRGVPVYFAVHAPGRGPAWEKENMGCLGGGEKREKKKGKKEGTFDNRIHRFKSVFPRICCYPRWKLIFFPPRYFIPDIPRFFSRSSDITNKLESYYFRRVILANVLQFRFQKERYFLRIFNFSSTWSSRTTDTTGDPYLVVNTFEHRCREKESKRMNQYREDGLLFGKSIRRGVTTVLLVPSTLRPPINIP